MQIFELLGLNGLPERWFMVTEFTGTVAANVLLQEDECKDKYTYHIFMDPA